MSFEKFRLSLIFAFDYERSCFSDITPEKMPGLYECLEQQKIREVNLNVFTETSRRMFLDEEAAIVKVFSLKQKERGKAGLHHNENCIYHFTGNASETGFQVSEVKFWFFNSGKAYLTLLIKAENLHQNQVLDLKSRLVNVREKRKITYQRLVGKGCYEERKITFMNVWEKLRERIETAGLPIAASKHDLSNSPKVFSLFCGIADHISEEDRPVFMDMLCRNRRSGMVSTASAEDMDLCYTFDHIYWAVSENSLSAVGDCRTGLDRNPANLLFLRERFEESVMKVYLPFYLYFLSIHQQCEELEKEYSHKLEYGITDTGEQALNTLKILGNSMKKHIFEQNHMNRLFLDCLCKQTLKLTDRISQLYEDYQSLAAKHKYNTFISYRRDGGGYPALLISYILRNEGKDVFLDVDSMHSDKFDKQLHDVIENCTNVIVILSPGSLDHCCKTDEEDWVRKEITWAMELKKNIIPVMLEGFEYPGILPESMKDFDKLHALSCNLQDFSYVMERISAMMK